MTIRARGKKFVLVSGSGKTLGTHSTKGRAEAQESAINISKARKAGHHIPRVKRHKAKTRRVKKT